MGCVERNAVVGRTQFLPVARARDALALLCRGGVWVRRRCGVGTGQQKSDVSCNPPNANSRAKVALKSENFPFAPLFQTFSREHRAVVVSQPAGGAQGEHRGPDAVMTTSKEQLDFRWLAKDRTGTVALYSLRFGCSLTSHSVRCLRRPRARVRGLMALFPLAHRRTQRFQTRYGRIQNGRFRITRRWMASMSTLS